MWVERFTEPQVVYVCILLLRTIDYYFRDEAAAEFIEDDPFRHNAFTIIMEMLELSPGRHLVLVDEVCLIGTALLYQNVSLHIVTPV